MQPNETLSQAFDAQITLEFESAIAYRQLAIAMDAADLPGIAGWLRAQADEEIAHAERFIAHVIDRGGRPRIGAIEAPDHGVESVRDCFEAALAHERLVSQSIRDLYRTAEGEGDLDSRPLLNWFIEEQIEEEATVSEILGRIALIGDDGIGMLKLDEELASRGSGPEGV